MIGFIFRKFWIAMLTTIASIAKNFVQLSEMIGKLSVTPICDFFARAFCAQLNSVHTNVTENDRICDLIFNDILLNIDEYFGPKFSVINGTCQHYISHRILRWAQFNFHKLSASAWRFVRSWVMVHSQLKRFLKKSRINSLTVR